VRVPLLPLALGVVLAAGSTALGEDRGATLQAAAAATRAKLAKSAARWTVVYHTRQGARVEVEVVRTPFATRRLLRLQLRDRPPREVLRVIEREGTWYATEVGGVRGIYLPREAPFLFPSAYRYLDDARLPLVGEAKRLGSFQTQAKGRWRYRRALSSAQEANLRRVVASLERLVQVKPTPQVKVRLIQARGALAEGIVSEVDPLTGLLHSYGPPDRRARLVAFRWLEKIELSDFVTEGETLPDRRAPLKGESVQLAHCGIWQAGSPRAEVDLRLVSLLTGEVRRVPTRLVLSLPGARSGEVLFPTAPSVNGIGLYRVTLPKGTTQRLGGRALSRGACLRPTLSPDGRTLSLFHLKGDTGKAQVTLVDLAKPKRVRLIGTPLVTGSTLSWFPKGDALLLTRRVAFLPDEKPYSSVVRLTLKGGALREILRGESPVFVGGGKRILYRDKGGRWRTCDLKGLDRHLVGEGLVGYESPAPGPKGARVLMLETTKQGPRPVVVDVATGKAKPLKIQEPCAGGLWALPRW
jgi:hypothetical protein